MQCRTSAFAMLCLLCGAAVLSAAEIRYDDVIYLDEWKQPALHLKALHRTPLTFSRDQSSILAYLAPGEVVEIVGLGETQHYVAARIPTGPARGWVDAQALEAPPAELVAKLQARREKAQAHREMIERHEIALTMTRTEVRASLGKPDRTSRLRSREGGEEQWFYTEYKYLPYYTQTYDGSGELRQVVSYRREPTGRKVITFRNDEAVEIAEEQGDKTRSPSVIIVPPAPAGN
jgi:hypothetical protein